MHSNMQRWLGLPAQSMLHTDHFTQNYVINSLSPMKSNEVFGIWKDLTCESLWKYVNVWHVPAECLAESQIFVVWQLFGQTSLQRWKCASQSAPARKLWIWPNKREKSHQIQSSLYKYKYVEVELTCRKSLDKSCTVWIKGLPTWHYISAMCTRNRQEE